MKNRLSTLLLLLILHAPLASCLSADNSFVWCDEDQEISAEKRKQLGDLSFQVGSALESGDAERISGLLSSEARREFRGDQVAATLRQLSEQLGPLQETTIRKMYLVRLSGRERITPASCGGTPERPQDAIMVLAKAGTEQSYVLLETKGTSETVTSTLWLIPEAGHWRLQALFFVPSTILARPAEWYWEQAKMEKGHGHLRNAMVLYSGAMQMAFRGQFFQSGVYRAIEREMQQMQPPVEIRGRPPFVWKGESSSFSVKAIASGPVSGKLYLVLVHEVDVKLKDEQIQQSNRQLMQLVMQRFPEYQHVFHGLVVAGDRNDGSSGSKTVETFEGLRK